MKYELEYTPKKEYKNGNILEMIDNKIVLVTDWHKDCITFSGTMLNVNSGYHSDGWIKDSIKGLFTRKITLSNE